MLEIPSPAGEITTSSFSLHFMSNVDKGGE